MKRLFSEIPCLRSERLLLRRITPQDAGALEKLANDREVYRWLPTFLYEQKYRDINRVIAGLYDECMEESLFLGIELDGRFCGIIELYGYREEIRKISVGYRLLKEFWGRGIAAEALGRLIAFLDEETDIEILTASSMIENRASASVLLRNGFTLVSSGMYEDWGREIPVAVDKWIR